MADRQGFNSDGEIYTDPYIEHDPVDLRCADDGMTRQEFAAECDINVLMARYERTGVLNHFSSKEPQYLDLTAMPDDLMAAMSMMDAAAASFMRLPATVRREFDNDPMKFVAYAEVPENLPKLREWGLAPPEPVIQAESPPSEVPPSASDK